MAPKSRMLNSPRRFKGVPLSGSRKANRDHLVLPQNTMQSLAIPILMGLIQLLFRRFHRVNKNRKGFYQLKAQEKMLHKNPDNPRNSVPELKENV